MKPTDSSTPLSSAHSQAAKAETSSRFRAFDALSDAISIVDKDLTVVYMNAACKAECGDLVGKKCSETALASPEICRECPVKIGWDYDKGPYTRQATDAKGRSIEMYVTTYRDPETQEEFWISIEHDISQRVTAEKRLSVLTSSIHQMTEPVCVADTEGNLIYVNRAYIALTGHDAGEPGLSLAGPSSDSPGTTLQAILRAASQKEWSSEMYGLRKDGTRYYTQVEAKPVKDGSGTTLGVVGILRDVTRSKTEKLEFEKYKQELESRMEARTNELARKVSQLTTINKISRVVTSILDLDELISEYVKAIAQGFGYRHVSMMMMDRERGDLFFKAGYGWKMDSVPKDLKLKLKEGIIGNAAYFGETLVTGDVEADPRYVRKDLTGTRSELAVPVTYRGEVLGVLDVQSDVKDAFTRNDVSTVEMLADILATSITNARIYSELREREAALTVLDRISKQISYRLEPNVVLDQVARDAATLLKAEKAAVALVDESTKALRFISMHKMDKSLLSSKSYSPEKGITGRALKTLKTEVANDYMSDPDAVDRDADLFGIKSIVVAPLTIEGRGIGAINVYNKLGGKPFTKSDILFLSSLADHAAIALENANLLSSLNQRVHSQLALLETALSMQRQIDTGSAYELIAEKLREVVAYDGLTFYKLDREKMMLSGVYSKGPYSNEILAEVFSVDVGITGCVARTGRAELVNDSLHDPRVAQVAGTPEEEEALMAIPLVGKEQVIGVLAMYRDGGAVFTQTEFDIAQLFANQAAVTVENSELYKSRELLLADSSRKVEQMAKVLELMTSVMYMDDIDKLLQRVADVVVQSFGFARCSLSVYDPEKDVFVFRGLSGFPGWVGKGTERPGKVIIEDLADEYRVGTSCYYVPFEKQSYGIDAFYFLAHPEQATKPRISPSSWHERDIFGFALKDRNGRLSGYLEMDEPKDWTLPTKEDIEVLEILAGIASMALENSKAYGRQVVAANEIALLNDLMTHDINNFNQGIMGYIELLLEDKRLDDNQRKYAERALLQVRNNARLIDNIRKLAKVRMMSDADFELMDVQKAVAEAVAAVTKPTADKKITVVSTIAENAHFVMANQFLHELFFNVISNAVKFDTSPRVRVDVSISEEQTPQGAYWIVSVTDRGRGIPDDRKKAVFERFATGMTGIKGFGLGLSIVRSIVDKLGGRAWVEDRIKGDFAKGTAFKIALPKAQQPSESPAAKPEADS